MKTKKEYNRPHIEIIELELEEIMITASQLKESFGDKSGVNLQQTNSFWNENNIIKGDEE